MIDQKTQTTVEANDVLQAIIQQRNAALDAVVQLQAVIAAKDREIAEWREKFAGAQALNVDQKSA